VQVRNCQVISFCRLLKSAVLYALCFGVTPTYANDSALDEWAAERETNFYEIPSEWRLTQPVTLTIRFALKHELDSEGAQRFLEALESDIGSLTFGTNFQVRPVVVPTKFHYAMSIDFASLAAWRRHETSPALLEFVGSYWRDNVASAEETVVITPKN